MQIYVTLLKQMAPEHLLATFAKLCAEILAAASDGMLNIDDITGQSVLKVFASWCSKTCCMLLHMVADFCGICIIAIQCIDMFTYPTELILTYACLPVQSF